MPPPFRFSSRRFAGLLFEKVLNGRRVMFDTPTLNDVLLPIVYKMARHCPKLQSISLELGRRFPLTLDPLPPPIADHWQCDDVLGIMLIKSSFYERQMH